MPDELGGGGGYDAGSVFIGVEADTTPFFAEMDAIATRANRIPTVRVDFDHAALSAGNKHIESKFTHVVDVNRRLAQNAIAPRYDGSQLNQLTADLRAVQGQVDSLRQQRIQLEATLNADSVRSQLDAIANQPRVIYYSAVVQMPDIQAIQAQMTVKASVTGLGEAINPELKKAFKDAAKEARGGNILGAIGSVAAAPFKIAGGAISQAVGGAVFGLGQQLTNDFSKGLTASIGGKLAGSVGSPALLGEKAGDLLANLAGAARNGIVARAKQANSAIDKALTEGTLEFGNFSLPVDSILPRGFKRPDLINLKAELSKVVSKEVENYLNTFNQIFPEIDRQAEAAAQRARITRRRQSVAAVSPQQIIDENQTQLQELARQRARGSNILITKSAQEDEVRGQVRAQRREASNILKDIVRAGNDPKIREEIITQAADDIPKQFEAQIDRLQNAYQETVEKINAKNAEIVKAEKDAAAIGVKADPLTQGQRQDDLVQLRAQAAKQQEDIRLQRAVINQDVETYLAAARGDVDAAPILAKLKAKVIEQVKVLGEPLRQVQAEKAEIQAALNAINSQIEKISESSFIAASPESRRLVLQRRVAKQQRELGATDAQISGIESSNEELLSRDSFSQKDADAFRANVLQIAELQKRRQRIEKRISKSETELRQATGSVSDPVKAIFKEIFSELGVQENKFPAVIVDSVAARQQKADAFYDPAANAIIIKAELNDAIRKGAFTDKQKGILREEITHNVQLASGSAKALQNIAEAKLTGEQIRPVVRVSQPTPEETRRLSQELQPYQSVGRGQSLTVELEAKVLRDRLAAREKDQQTIAQITQKINAKAGFAGAALEGKYKEYIKSFVAEIDAIKKIEGIDASELIEAAINEVSAIANSTNQYLDQIARLNLGQVDSQEAAKIDADFDQQVNEIKSIFLAKKRLIEEVSALVDAKEQKAESQIVPAQSSAVARSEGRQTVGGAIAAVTDGVIVPAAKRAGESLVAFAKAGYKVADGIELAGFSLLGPIGIALRQPLKAGIRAGVTGVGLPMAAFGVASSFPVVGSGIQSAQNFISSGVGSLAGFGGARVGGAIANNLVQSLGLDQIATFGQSFSGTPIVGKLGQALSNLPTEFTGKIVEAATGAFSSAGSSIATAATTIFGGKLIVDGAQKGLGIASEQAAKGLSAAGSSIINNKRVQAVAETQIPFTIPEREKVLEFAENAGVATRKVVDAASSVLEPIVNKVSETAQRIQSIDKNEAVQIAADLGKKTRLVVDQAVGTIEDTINAVELLTAKLPGGQKLVDLSRQQLEGLKRQLETKFERAVAAESAGQPVIGGSSVIQGDIQRVQQVIEAKAEGVPTTAKITKAQYENDLKKIIQAESKQIEKLRSQLIENLRQGATSDALRVAEQLKSSSQSALGKLEAFKGNTGLDLEPAIRKSVNGYISRFKGLIAQAETATAKVTNGEDFGTLLSINTEQIAENFVGLINKLFEVEGKNLQDALGKAALSPRAKDIAVAGAGVVGGVAGRQLGIVSGIGGEITGAVAMRSAVSVGEQAIAARNDLLQTETYQTATALEKLQQVVTLTAQRLNSPEVQAALGRGLTGDLAGSGLGNLSAILGNLVSPGAGAVTGAVGGIGGAGQIQKIRDLINERVNQASGGSDDFPILRSIDQNANFSDRQIETLKEVEEQLAEIQRLYQQIEDGAKRVAAVEAEIAQTEGRNRRNLRFDTVDQDRGQRSAALEVERLKRDQITASVARSERANRITPSDLSTVLGDIRPSAAPDRLAQIKSEVEAEKAALSERLEAQKRAGQEERRLKAVADQERKADLSDRLAAIKKETQAIQAPIVPKADPIQAAQQERLRQEQRQRDTQPLILSPSQRTQNDLTGILEQAKAEANRNSLTARLEAAQRSRPTAAGGVILPAAGRPQSPDIKTSEAVERIAAIKAEADAQRQSTNDRLAAIKAERDAERNAVNARLAEIKAQGQAEKAAQNESLINRLEAEKTVGTRQRLTAATQPAARQTDDLSQFLSRVPGTSGGGRGPRVPGPPTLFIPDVQPRITAFDAAKRAASGFLGIIDKIPAPIKNIFFLLGGGFVGFQAFQLLTSQANESFQAIKRLESQRVVVNFATGSTAPLEAAEKQAKALGTNLVASRDAIKSLAIQAKNTPLEQRVVPIFEGASTAAAALQLNPEQQGRLFTAFNQIAGKGTVQSEELRQQLGELGVSFQLAARAAGMTTAEFNKQLAAGAILSQDFLPKFANQLKLELGGAALAAGDSLQGLENKVANAATKLQEGLGKESIPLVSTGLKAFGGILEFAANNVSTLTNLINVALLGALVKGGQAFKNFAFEQQTITSLDARGNVASAIRSSRAGRVFQGARDFVSGGGIQRFAQSEFAKDIASIGTQVIALSAGIGAFQTITEGFSGGERYQEFNKVLETTEKRIQAINAAERDRLALRDKQPGRTGDEVRKDLIETGAGAIGDLASLNFKGFFQKTARNFQQLTGGDPTTALSEGFLATQEQADNRRILNSATDVLGSKQFQDERNKAFALATRLRSNQAVNPDELKSSRETIQSRIDLLKAVPEDLRKLRPEIDAEIKQLEKLQNALAGTGSEYSKLVKAAQEFENIISKQNALDKAVASADVSRDRARGTVNEFDAKIAENKAQSIELSKNRDALGNLVKASEKFIGSQEFAALQLADPEKANAERKRLLDLKTQYAQSDKQIDDLITQNRLDAVNRRSELLQREITDQDNFRAKLEARSRVNTSGAQLGIAQRQSNRTISPFQAQIEQSAIAQQESSDKVAQLNQKLVDQRKNATQALRNLQQVNPVDEQAYQAAKTQYEGLRNSAIQTQAEINDARKQGFDAVAQSIQATEENIRAEFELTARAAEQGVTKQQQAVDRLGNAQKRQIEESVAGLQRQQKFLDLALSSIERTAKLAGKRFELTTALNQGAQIPLSGTIAAIRDAEGLIQRLKQKDLDPAVRGRTAGVLNQLGISNNERDAFAYRIREEEKLARLKADGISAEIQQSQITLDFEQRREEFAAKRAILAAQETAEAAKRSAIETEIERKKAENEARRSQIGVLRAEGQLQLAQRSGDPLKVQDAALNLEDAKLTAAAALDTLTGARQTEKLAKNALPTATLSVVDALANFAATIEGGKLSRRILGIQNQNKVAQFGQEERGRVRGLAIEGIDKGVEVNINSGGAAGFDPFGFGAARSKQTAEQAKARAEFQDRLRGRAIAPAAKIDTSATTTDPVNAVDAAIKAVGAAINFDPVTQMLGRLVEIEERLSAQILSLAGRAQVKVTNQSYYGQDRNVLAGTTL